LLKTTIRLNILQEMPNGVKPYLGSAILFIFCSTLHFTIPHIYIYLCTPKTVLGFLISPLKACSPECKALRWIHSQSIKNITFMKDLFVCWAISLVICFKKKTYKKLKHKN